ncbi:MAG TPA: GAF domain-containing sensor histidine kinase [Candidatus Limnocylindrales bacterium]|nr:GAF domain-containing sensor histidine kinase [Candidatus Limnocylindrales bacterium]
MATRPASLLPVHQLLAVLEDWRADPSPDQQAALAASLERVLGAYGASGAYLALSSEALPELALGVGSLAGGPEAGSNKPVRRDLAVEPMTSGDAVVWVDAPADAADAFADVLQLAVDSAWSKQEARLRRRQLEGLDLAVRGIAGVLSVERVLQLIVDRVRELVDAEYAALGIVGPFGKIDQFVTSGVTPEERARIGALPRGLGLLGLIMREDRAFVIDDVGADPRSYGFPENHPRMHSFLGAPVRNKGRSIGNLYLTNKRSARTFNDADLRLVEMFALHAGIAIENARLHEEIGRLAIVDERQRISQDLHDSIIQSLYAISLSLEDLPDIITEDPFEGATRADRAIDGIHATIRDIRNFIMGLQPELLIDADLGAGIETLAAEFRANTLIDLELRIEPELPELPRDHAAHILAITREALSNIARHSTATRASIELAVRDDALELVIGDNGRGFDVDGARSSRQRGLANLRARAEAVGGKLTLTSEAGAGTRVTAEIPTSGPAAAGAPAERSEDHQ